MQNKVRKCMTKICSALLATSMLATSVPVAALADETQTGQETEDTIAVSDNSAVVREDEPALTQQEDAEEETEFSDDEDGIMRGVDPFDIFSFDWKNATDEEITSAIADTNEYDCKAWLSSLSQEDKDLLLSRDTYLTKTYDVYNVAEDPEDVHCDHYDTYVDYLGQLPEKLNWLVNAATGSMTFTIGGKSATVTLKNANEFRSNLSSSAKANCAHGNTVAVSGGAGAYNLKYASGGTSSWATVGDALDDSPNWEWVSFALTYDRPAGYKATGSSQNTSGKFGVYTSGPATSAAACPAGTVRNNYNIALEKLIVLYNNKKITKNASDNLLYSGNMTAYSNTTGGNASTDYLHVLANLKNFGFKDNAGVTGTKATYTIALTPITYYVTWNNANKATCNYGATYYHPAKAADQTGKYTVYFQGQDGKECSSRQYANWTVPFASWGGKLAGSAFSNLTVTNGQSFNYNAVYGNKTVSAVTLPSAPTIAGQTFQGWYAGNTKVGMAGDKYTPSNDVALTAIYNTEKYTVTIDGNGGTFYAKGSNGQTTFSSEFFYGSKLEWRAVTYNQEGYVDAGAYNFVRKGYHLNGFTATGSLKDDGPGLTANGLNLVEAVEHSYTVQGNGKLTAIWQPNTYKITYNPGENGTVSVENQNVTFDEDCPAPPTPSKTGYTFKKWEPAENGMQFTGKYTYDGDSTINAVYDANKYTVKFDLDGGINPDASYDDYAATYDQEFTLPAAPVKKGYNFNAWTYNGSEYPAGLNASNLTTENGASVILKADYAPQMYIVKFETDIGSKVEDQAYYYGDTDPLPVSERQGYTFKGWKDASGQAYATAADISNKLSQGSEREITLKAVFEKINTGGGTVTPDPVDPVIVDNTKELQDILAILQKLNSTADLTRDELLKLKTALSSELLLTQTQSQLLIDLINSSSLTEAQKLELLRALASGMMTDAQKELILNLVKNSGLADADKKALLAAIAGLSSLTEEQQKKILSALEAGSSADITLNGITYSFTKTKEGTISAAIKSLNGKSDVTIPDFVVLAGKTIPITDIAAGAFKGNGDLKSVTMGDNVIKIGDGAFEGAKNLKSVAFGNGLREIGKNAFKNCTSLGSAVTLPAALQTIGTSAFEGCSKLEKIVIKETSRLLEIGKKAFFNTGLKSFKVPASVLKIQDSAFASNKNMTKFTFDKNSALVSLGKGVWEKDAKLKSIKLPSKVAKVPAKAFKGCRALTSCKLASGTTDIGASAFEGCVKLKAMTVPSKVSSIGKKAFFGDKKLAKVTFKGKILQKVGAKAFKKCKKTIVFKCPKSKLGDYKKKLKGKY